MKICDWKAQRFMIFSLFILYLCLTCFAPSSTAMVCETGARQKPLFLTKSLALLAGDVVNFKVNGADGWLGPSSSVDITDTCLEIPLSVHQLNMTDTQFIIVPVAVLDEATVEQLIEEQDGTTPGVFTKPRLVSTIQLVHVASGRLLGTKKTTTITSSIVPPPILLPSQFGGTCQKTIEKYNSIWDLDVHEIDHETATGPPPGPGPGPPGPPIPPPTAPSERPPIPAGLEELFPSFPGSNSAGSVSTTTPSRGFMPQSTSQQGRGRAFQTYAEDGASVTTRANVSPQAIDTSQTPRSVLVRGDWPDKSASVVSRGRNQQDPIARAQTIAELNLAKFDVGCMVRDTDLSTRSQNRDQEGDMNDTHGIQGIQRSMSPFQTDERSGEGEGEGEGSESGQGEGEGEGEDGNGGEPTDPPNDPPVDPSDPPVDPPVDPVDPADPPLDPPVDPPGEGEGEGEGSDPPSDPTDPPVDPPADPPADPPTDPTDPPVDPPTDPTDPPADPPTDPTDPPSDPPDSSENDSPPPRNTIYLQGPGTESGVNDLMSTLFSRDIPPPMLGLENFTGTTGGEALIGSDSIESAAANAASAASSSLLNTSPTNLFTDRAEGSLNSQQQTFLEQHLGAMQAQQMSSNSNLTSVAHASLLGIQTAMVSLRIREIGVGPVELVKPCNGYLTQPELNVAVDGITTKPVSIFGNSGTDRGGGQGGRGGRGGLTGHGVVHRPLSLRSRKVKLSNGNVVDSNVAVLRPTYSGTAPKIALSYTHEKTDPTSTNWTDFGRTEYIDDDDEDEDEDDDDDDDEDGEEYDEDEEDNDEDDDDDEDEEYEEEDQEDQDLDDSSRYKTQFDKGNRKLRTPQSRRRKLSDTSRFDSKAPKPTTPGSKAQLPKEKKEKSSSGASPSPTSSSSSSSASSGSGKNFKVSSMQGQSKKKFTKPSFSKAKSSFSQSSFSTLASWLQSQVSAVENFRSDWNPAKLKKASTLGISTSRSRRNRNNRKGDKKGEIPSNTHEKTPFSKQSSPFSTFTSPHNAHLTPTPGSIDMDGAGFEQSKSQKPKAKNTSQFSSMKATTAYIPGTIPKTGDERLDSFLRKVEKTVSTTSIRTSVSTSTSMSPGVDDLSSGKQKQKTFQTMQTQQDSASGQSHCTMRTVVSQNGVRSIECIPTASSCPTPAAVESNTLWAITRVPFNDVPTSSLFLSESLSNLNYDMDYATINTYPFMIGQMGLRNFSPFEQFLTAKCSKIVTNEATFKWLVGITPSIGIAAGELPGAIFGGLSTILNNLLRPLVTFLDSILPGIAAIIPDLALPTVTLGSLSLAIPLVWSGEVTHVESQEIVVSYSVTAPPQAHVMGRAIAHMGKSSVPFTLDVSRRVHVPAGIYGQTTGQLIAFDYRVPGVYEGAKLINTEFLIDTV